MGYFSGLFPELEEEEQDQPVLPPSQGYTPQKRLTEEEQKAKDEANKKSGAGAVISPSQSYPAPKAMQDAAKTATDSAGVTMQKALKLAEKATDVLDQYGKRGTSMERGVAEDFKYPKDHQNDGQQPELDGQEDQPVDSAGKPKPAEPPNPNHIRQIFEGLGVYGLDARLGVFAAGMGLTLQQLSSPIGASAVGPSMLRVIAAMDKKNELSGFFNAEQSAAQRYDREAKAREDGKMAKSEQMEVEEERRLRLEREYSQNRIAGKEQQLRQLYDRLKETPIMRTWYGMIAYVLLSILTRSPSFAARTLMGSQHPEVLGNELRRIQESIEKEDRWGQHLGQQYSASRRQAIENQRRREEVVGTREYEQSQKMRAFNFDIVKLNIAAQNAARASRSKEAQNTVRSLKGMADEAIAEKDSLIRQMNHQDSIINNTFGDEGLRKEAKAKKLQLTTELNDVYGKVKFYTDQLNTHRKIQLQENGVLVPEEAPESEK